MIFKQYYLGCLAHASYLVADDGVAAVIDPQRDVEQYLTDARAAGATIEYIIETHLHADFVSGHVELARRTGAGIYLGRRGGASFEHVPVRQDDTLALGRKRLRFLETPGHTPEGISVLIEDAFTGQAEKVLTGDTLFVGDVGRPDLVASRGFGAEEMASMLFDSLHQRLLTLPDETEVFPAHGAGSACGRFMSEERSSTIGRERETNRALQALDRAAFVKQLIEGLPPAPAYFSHDAELNRRGAPELPRLSAVARLSVAEVEAMAAGGAVLLDIRAEPEFASSHVPGSLHIGLSGAFASWAGTLLPLDAPIVLVADGDAQAEEALVRLARVGIDAVAGLLEGGVSAWQTAGRPAAAQAQIEAGELRRRLAGGQGLVVDVRRKEEHEAGHIPGAIHVPLAELAQRRDLLEARGEIYVACASGYRSMIGASLLRRLGRADVLDVAGGHQAWLRAAQTALP